MTVPHPFPYQGSKRRIASQILPYIPTDTRRLIEPFCGSAAVSIAAASLSLAHRFVLNDIDPALMTLWEWILNHPSKLAERYEQLWNDQHPNRKEFFFQIRDEFNRSHQPHHLLYLLARIVKGSVRYSSEGSFNQSPDNRRSGMSPNKMRIHLLGVSTLLAGKTTLSATDFRMAVSDAALEDLVYMDPPYQGTSFTRDHRYYDGLTYEDLAEALSQMNEHGISYILSYDGHTGSKSHGRPLPSNLLLEHRYVHAGRSSQATLLGTCKETVESLYLSPALVERLSSAKTDQDTSPSQERRKQLALI